MFNKIINYFLNKKFVRFCVSGGIATLADVGLLYILTEFVGVWYLLSAGLSFILGTIIHYFICSQWVFKVVKQSAGQYLIFVLIQTVGLAINLAVIYILVEYFSVWYILAKLVAVFVGLIWNFFANLKITFRNSNL